MTAALIAGAVAGLGVYLLVRALVVLTPPGAVRLARLDVARSDLPRRAFRSGADDAGAPSGLGLRDRLGLRLEAGVERRGLALGRTRADLAVLDRPLGQHLATKVLFAVGALVWMPLMWTALGLFGIPLPPAAPLVLTVVLAGAAFFLPDLQLRSDAEQRRKDFLHVLGSYLDLVAMNLAGGRGLPEALVASATVGDHWALVRIRQALLGARLEGLTPWEAMGRLGQEAEIEELRDLAGALTLAGDEGAKIRSSLTARAESLRRKELADAEGRAGERSQSMLIAQMLICASFLVFLAYPATYSILRS